MSFHKSVILDRGYVCVSVSIYQSTHTHTHTHIHTHTHTYIHTCICVWCVYVCVCGLIDKWMQNGENDPVKFARISGCLNVLGWVFYIKE